MKVKIEAAVAFIEQLWGKLPAEVKVGLYWCVAVALTSLADGLLGNSHIQIDAVLKVFLANVLLVFVKNLKNRAERIQNLLGK